MKTVHLAPGHPQLDTRVFHKECRALSAAGHEVVLLVATGDEPTVIDGISIESIRRPNSRLGRFLLSPLRLLRRAWQLDADCYHMHDVEALPVGAVMSLRGKHTIWDSHEDLPRLVADRPWIPPALRGITAVAVGLLERVLVRRFDLVISAEDVGARRFPASKTKVVRNHPLESEFSTVPGPKYRTRGNVVAYVGDVTRQRGALEMIRAISLLPERLQTQLVIGGRINEPGLLEEMRHSPGWSRTDHRGVLDRTAVLELLGEARVGLVLLHPIRKYAEGAVPVKVFEYMAAGLPVIASDLPVLREILLPHEAGMVVDPLSVDQIAEAIEQLLSHPAEAAAMGERGRAAVLAQYSWSKEADVLIDSYSRL